MIAAEEWRTVSGHPDYEVSNLGRVRSLKGCTPRILRPFTDKLGYVRLNVDGKHASVHRMVAGAWHGPCPAGMEVDHINHVRNDNRAENLRYLTRQQNMKRMTERRVPITECKHGHPLAGDNVYIRPSGRRCCRTCNNDLARQHRERVAAQPVPLGKHGTLKGYQHGCRCADCKGFHSEYRRANRLRRQAA